MDCFIFTSVATGEVIAVEDENLERAHQTAESVFEGEAEYTDCISTEEAEDMGFDIY